MTKAHKLTGILALLALFACASNRGTTTGAAGGASATPGTPTGSTTPTGPATTDTTPGAVTPPSTSGTSMEGRGQTDCSNVRCMSCPTGQHPALTPPDCCRCVTG